MALLGREYSYRHQLIIQELVLETSLVPIVATTIPKNNLCIFLGPLERSCFYLLKHFEFFKEYIIHCRIMYWYPPCQVNASKSLVMPPNFQREVMLRVYTYIQINFLC